MTAARTPGAARRSVAIAAAIAVTTVPVLAQAQVVGVNSAVRNKATVRTAGTAPPRPAVVGQKVAMRDVIQTAPASQLQMLLLDGSVFSVGPNAQLAIDRFVYDPNRNTKAIGASVARGAFRFMSGRARQSADSSIRTPIATIGIRGTIVEGVIGDAAIRIAAGEAAVGPAVGGDPASASLIILRGPGIRTQGNARPGAVDIQAGGTSVAMNQPMLAVYVPGPGRAPIGPFTISGAGLLAVSNLLYPLSVATAVAVQRAQEPGGPPSSASSRSGSVERTGDAGRASNGGRSFLFVAGAAAVALLAVLLVDGSGDPDSP